MAELIGIYFLPALLIVGVAEIVLLAIRKKKGISMIYVATAAFVRALAYSPSAVGIGHGGVILPLALGLALGAAPDAEAYAWGGLPALGVALLSFGLSCARHRARLFSNKNEKDA